MTKHIFLNSDDSKHIHTKNNPYDFTVELSDPLELIGKWKVALSEIEFTGTSSSELYVYSDICQYNHVLDNQLPILRRVHYPGEVSHLYFIPINRPQIARIRIYIRDRYGQIPPNTIARLNCTLLLKHG